MRSYALGAAGVAIMFALGCVPACSSSNDAPPQDGLDASGGGFEASTGSETSTTDGGPKTDGATDSGPAGPTCTDKTKNGAETDVDCGGTCPDKCKLLQGCKVAPDCMSGLICAKNVCAAPSSTDGIKTGSETDIDCGGLEAPPCEPGKDCLVPADCKEKVCDANKCADATPTDGVKNGNETDIDCGGGAPAPACIAGKACAPGQGLRDCESKVCTGGVCQAPTPSDGVQNGNETDVDCGGGAPAPACGNGKTCVVGAQDCTSLVCTGGVCQPPKGDDGVKNGDESDIDCGGTTTGAPKCGPGLTCNAHADCASDGCNYNGVCAYGRSCTQHNGGDTCGTGEVGQPGAAHEDCCMRATLTGSAVTIDKYHVTAGRMRAFMTRLNGNVRAFAPGTAGWNAAWNNLVPANLTDVNTMLGSYWNGAPNDNNGAESKRSCQPNGFGGHTYATTGAGEAGDYTQAQLDPKALNCVGWHIARAFCAWEGGRLPTSAELSNAFTNNGANAYPWQWQDASAYDPGVADFRLNHQFNYGFPGNNPRMVSGTVQDIAWFVSPPGRFPSGANANGVQDIAGDLLHWVSNGEYLFTWTMSWERHNKNLGTTNWSTGVTGGGQPNGYYGIGLRCAYP